ncbi:MAG: helix-turn-helix transcriptional regulator [Spirochaetaceae bacterium]|nr:MAG: helix-turn-helix transcriptional regulator [Spirochaetaceae bacterium]
MAIIWFAYYGPAGYLLFARGRFTLTTRERKLYRILGASVVALILAATLEVLVAPLLFGIPSQGNVLGFKFLWLLGVAFVVDRFRYLTAPADLDEIALSHLPGNAVIVLDREQKVHSANGEAGRLLALPEDHGGQWELRSLLPGNVELHREIAALADHGHDSVSCVIALARNGSTPTLLDVRVSLLRDASGNHLGYLLLGSGFEGIRNIELVGRLSRREIEIVQEVIQGHRNGEIAARLFISERTVKTHLTHIFSKLGVESRLELYTLLKDANVVSQHRAEKKLLLVNSGREPHAPSGASGPGARRGTPRYPRVAEK